MPAISGKAPRDCRVQSFDAAKGNDVAQQCYRSDDQFQQHGGAAQDAGVVAIGHAHCDY